MDEKTIEQMLGQSAPQSEVDIFDEVPDQGPVNYVKFANIGDSVQGTYVGRNDNSVNSYGAPQTLVTLKKSDGETATVSIRHAKIGLLKILDQCRLGEIIGFKFTGVKENVGRNPTKYIRLVHDPKIVDTAWLAEHPQGAATYVPTASSYAPVGATSVNGVVTYPKPQVATANGAPAQGSTISNETKIQTIITLAKTKYGATDEASIRAKIMEKTGLAFVNVNLDAILAKF